MGFILEPESAQSQTKLELRLSFQPRLFLLFSGFTSLQNMWRRKDAQVKGEGIESLW